MVATVKEGAEGSVWDAIGVEEWPEGEGKGEGWAEGVMAEGEKEVGVASGAGGGKKGVGVVGRKGGAKKGRK